MAAISEEQAEALANAFLATINDVYQACVASQRRRDVTPGSPLSLDHDRLLTTGSAAADDLHRLGRTAASRAEVAAGHSLAAILRFLRHSDDVGPATSALFPLARAVIEGAAIAHYLHDPRASLNQRLLRTAQILVWSEQSRRTFLSEFSQANPTATSGTATDDSWAELETLLDNASIVQSGQNDRKPWQKLTREGDSVGRFEIFALMREINADTPLLYRTLSGVAHHTPWITDLHMRPTTADENGSYYGTQISQAQQVHLVANACHALLMAATAKSRFYGAETNDLDHLGETSLELFGSLADTILAMECGP